MEIKHHINGKWLSSSGLNEDLALLDHTNPEDRGLVEVALEGAKLSFEQVLRDDFFPLNERLKLLESLKNKIAHNPNEFAQAISKEVSKPIKLAKAEVTRALFCLESTIDAAKKMLGLKPLNSENIHDDTKFLQHFEYRKPIGPVFCITPYNFPLNLILHKIAPAIAAGCPVILKPSTKATDVAKLLVEKLEEAGIPAGFVNLINCTNEFTEELVQDERLAYVSFTGSEKVGWHLDKLIKCPSTLELGGNAATYVDKDANLKKAAQEIIVGAFGFAGQSCISTQNIFVPEKIYDNFRALLIQETYKLKWGEPEAEENFCSWVIDEDAAVRIHSLINRAVENGATVSAKAEPPRNWTQEQLDAFPTAVPPTLLESVPLDSEIVTQEAFAPVAILHKVESEHDFYFWLSSQESRLQTSVWTANKDDHLIKLMSLDFGGVLINKAPTYRYDPMPYGGRGKSGKGVEGPSYVIAELTHPTSVVIG